MKIGVRKPSIKKSIKARTTGKLKRKIKKSVNPLYSKKGMGYINNPKKAVYNKIYNKTTIGIPDLVQKSTKVQPHKGLGIFGIISAIFIILMGLILIGVGGLIFVILGIFLLIWSISIKNYTE